MRVLVLAAAVLAGSAVTTLAQSPAQTPAVKLILSKPMTTITLTSVPLVHALELVAGDFGIACEFDDSIPAEDLNLPMTARFTNARFDDVLSLMIKETGLTYRAIDAKTVRFEKKH